MQSDVGVRKRIDELLAEPAEVGAAALGGDLVTGKLRTRALVLGQADHKAGEGDEVVGEVLRHEVLNLEQDRTVLGRLLMHLGRGVLLEAEVALEGGRRHGEELAPVVLGDLDAEGRLRRQGEVPELVAGGGDAGREEDVGRQEDVVIATKLSENLIYPT